MLNYFQKIIVDVIRHAQHFEIKINRRPVEYAQHQALPKLSRQSRDAKIDMASRDIFLNAAILGQTALRDVHIRHHFNA